ncbi:MAG TPA: helix-turn-helix transcriptional regulator, partial [Ktedonobacterales bacterium]
MKAQQTQSRPNLALRRERERRHWTQSELALRIGATYLTVCRWENGTTRPSLYYRKQLCEVFGLPPEALGLAPEDGPTRGAEPRGQSAPSAVRAVWQVPFRRNPFFTGREAALARLALLLGTGKAAALSGLGGVGKTQMALEYAYRSAQDYQAVFWLRADSRDALAAGFLEIAHALNLPERDERDQAIMVAAIRGWFSQHTNWLLILDNADDLAFLPEFLPASLQGHLLLTTRAQALSGLASRVEIETLDQDTGPLLLLRRAGLLALDARLAQAEQTDWQAAVQLSQELGGLPLALDQAGAYLEETHCSLQQYLHLYRSHRTDLLRQRGGMAQDHPDSVATTWALSFAQVEQRSPLAADLLRLCAWLHPDAIPEE